MIYLICFASYSFVALEIAALVTGIIGRHSACGKAGLSISAILLVLTAIAAPFFMVSSSESIGPRMVEKTMARSDESVALSKEREERVQLKIKLEKGFQRLVRVTQDIKGEARMQNEQSEHTFKIKADLMLKCLDVAPDGTMTIMQEPRQMQITTIEPEGKSKVYYWTPETTVPSELKSFFIGLGRSYFFKIRPDGTIVSGRFEDSMDIYPPDAPKEQITKGPDWTDAGTPEARRFLDGLTWRWKGILLNLPQENLVVGKTVTKEYTYGNRPDKIERAWTVTNRNGSLIDVEIVSTADTQEVLGNTDSHITIHLRVRSSTKAKIDLKTGLVQSAERQWQSDQSMTGAADTQNSGKTADRTRMTGKETWRIIDDAASSDEPNSIGAEFKAETPEQLAEFFFRALAEQNPDKLLQTLPSVPLIEALMLKVLPATELKPQYTLSEAREHFATLPAKFLSTYRQAMQESRQLGIDWSSVKLKSIEVSRRKKEGPIEAFGKIYIRFESLKHPGDEFEIRLPDGLLLDGSWYLSDNWYGIEKVE